MPSPSWYSNCFSFSCFAFIVSFWNAGKSCLILTHLISSHLILYTIWSSYDDSWASCHGLLFADAGFSVPPRRHHLPTPVPKPIPDPHHNQQRRLSPVHHTLSSKLFARLFLCQGRRSCRLLLDGLPVINLSRLFLPLASLLVKYMLPGFLLKKKGWFICKKRSFWFGLEWRGFAFCGKRRFGIWALC